MIHKKLVTKYNNYQKTILDASINESLIGELVGDDVIIIEASNPLCGDKLKITIKVDQFKNILDSKYIGDGCILSRGSCAILIQFLQNKPASKILDLDFYSIIPIEKENKREDCFKLALNELLKIKF